MATSWEMFFKELSDEYAIYLPVSAIPLGFVITLYADSSFILNQGFFMAILISLLAGIMPFVFIFGIYYMILGLISKWKPLNEVISNVEKQGPREVALSFGFATSLALSSFYVLIYILR